MLFIVCLLCLTCRGSSDRHGAFAWASWVWKIYDGQGNCSEVCHRSSMSCLCVVFSVALVLRCSSSAAIGHHSNPGTDPQLMSCGQFVHARLEKIKAEWRRMVREGIRNGPSVIVLDDLDLLCPVEQELVIHFNTLYSLIRHKLNLNLSSTANGRQLSWPGPC